MTMMNKYAIYLVIPIALALSVASVYAIATNIGYIGASWNHDPVSVYIVLNKGVDPSYRTEVQTALNDWSSALKTQSGNSAQFNFNVLTAPRARSESR
jgi:hypothetical protein